tara:strand:+ start:223 stop:2214 length:1992 start_codon:yes stop_codon:yes gene_type:complete
MAYYFPQGYSGPYHDYYRYADDFVGVTPDATTGDPKQAKLLIEGINPNNLLAGASDLSGVFLKPRIYNNPGAGGNSDFKQAIEDQGGTANFGEITSWNCGLKSMFLLTPEHVLSTLHGFPRYDTAFAADRGFGLKKLQFMEKNGVTFNVELQNGGITLGAAFMDGKLGGTYPFAPSLNSARPGIPADTIVFKLSEPIVGKDVTYCNKFYAGQRGQLDSRGGSSMDVDIFSLKSQNTISYCLRGNDVNSNKVYFDSYNNGSIPKPVLFSCDSGSTTFVVHKTEGTLLTHKQANGVFITEENIGLLNEYLASEGYPDGITLIYDDQISNNWYSFFDFSEPLGSQETLNIPNYANNRTIQVKIVGTDSRGKKTKPVTKTIKVDLTGSPPPGISGSIVKSVLPISNHLHTSATGNTSGTLDQINYGSLFVAVNTVGSPKDDIYSGIGITNNCFIELSYGSTLSNSEFDGPLPINPSYLTAVTGDRDTLIELSGGFTQGDFTGFYTPITFPFGTQGLTVYARPSIENIVGSTPQSDWQLLGVPKAPGRGSTFTSFSFDNYGPTAGGTMIGTAAGYTAIPELGLNKIQNLFAFGGLTVGDIKINGASYVSGMTFSGPTFALKIPSDCPAGASLGIASPNGIQYINPYNLSVGVAFPGLVDGVTYINVGG